MKAPKLSKLKGNDATPKSPKSYSSPEVTLKASFDDLRSPNIRDLLRQHFSSAFPETQRRPSQEWTNNNVDMGVKDRLSRSTMSHTVGQKAAAKSSSSSLENATLRKKRLSAVPESNANKTIDIEQAIHLLQELKKSASPEELVALHKALLPTRDSIISNPPIIEEGSPDNRPVSLIRSKSLVPPGLATRGGASEDLLRRQEDVKPPIKSRKSKLDEWGRIRQKESKSSLAALDLADDQTNSIVARAATPVDQDYEQTGAYRPGTLRITNGAVSPDPSIMNRKSLEITSPDSFPFLSTASQDYRTGPTTPEDRGSQKCYLARTGTSDSFSENSKLPQEPVPRHYFDVQELNERFNSHTPALLRPRAPSMSRILVPEERDESTPRIYKFQRPRRSREPSATERPRSRDSSRSRLPLRVEGRPSAQSLAGLASKASKRNLGFSKESLEALRPEIDDRRVSSMLEDMPRFAERWSLRASQISQEYVSDCELTPGPYTDKSALLKRLSTVYDGEGEEVDATADETPEAALSKLNGIRTAEQTVDMMLADAARAPTPIAQSMNIHRSSRPTAPQKLDSGYGTDQSNQDRQLMPSLEAGTLNNLQLNHDKGISLDDDAQSLYSLQAILKSSSLLSTIVPSFPLGSPQNSTNSKKRSLFLKISSSGKSSLHAASISPVGVSVIYFKESSPTEAKLAKKKKLQKRMPDSLRQERKDQIRKWKTEQLEKLGTADEVPAVPEEPKNSFSVNTSEPEPVSALPADS